MNLRAAAELAANPDLMKPPVVLVPPCGVESMVTLMVLPPKKGKSTTACGMIAEASRRGVRCALLTLDEWIGLSLQRLRMFGADLQHVWLDDTFDDGLGAALKAQGVQFLAVDHLSKLAERNAAFGAGSQGDSILWGQLVNPFAELARTQGVSIVLLDQARRSDGKYMGSLAKAAGVDILVELQRKDEGIVGNPEGRVYLPPFTISLVAGKPVFSGAPDAEPSRAGRGDAISEADRAAVLAVLQSAEPEGFKSGEWKRLARDGTKLSERTFYKVKRWLHTEGLASYASRIYRVSPSGDRWLAKNNGKSPPTPKKPGPTPAAASQVPLALP